METRTKKARTALATPLPRIYGKATFAQRSKRTRKTEKDAKFLRELKKVNKEVDPEEVKYRVKEYHAVKKLLQKIFTGAEKMTCRDGTQQCKPTEKKKGPYLVSPKTVKQLATIIKLTPFDGATRGKRALNMVKTRVQADEARRKLIANIAAGKTNITNEKTKNFSITETNVEKRLKRVEKARLAAQQRAKKFNEILNTGSLSA